MPGPAGPSHARLGRLLEGLGRLPTPLAGDHVARVARLAAALWNRAFAAEVGAPCARVRPKAAGVPTVFGPCADPARDPAGYRAWHAAQGGLFLHYAPVAARLLGPDTPAAERAAGLLMGDALHLLDRHATGLGRPPGAYADLVPAHPPFASFVGRTDRPRSLASSDVNLGAVALALGLESGMRHGLGLPGEARMSMSRLFQALAACGDAVALAVDLRVLVAVYGWAARARHAGRRDRGWLNYFAADLMHPLFAPASGGFGLAAAPDVLERLRDAALGDPERSVPPAPVRIAA